MPDQRASVRPWKVGLLRATFFLKGAVAGTETLWREIVGEEPEIDDNLPRQGLRRQIGPIGKGQLEVQASAQRVDVLMTPRSNEANLPMEVHFGSLDEQFPVFSKLLDRWLPNPRISAVRVAFGAILLLPAADRKEAYAFLHDLVPSVRIDAAQVAELYYRVNRPTESKVVQGSKLNRITSWSCLQARSGSVVLVPDAEVAAVVPVSTETYVRLECDSSTTESIAEIDSKLLLPLFHELADLAVKNANSGELA